VAFWELRTSQERLTHHSMEEVSKCPVSWPGAMGLLCELVVDTADATTIVQIEANTKEEAPATGQELIPVVV
jgi:hypothetical protein